MNNKELLECVAAEEAGKKIECRVIGPKYGWALKKHSGWNTGAYEYRIAFEPAPKQGRWVRKEIKKNGLTGSFECAEIDRTIDCLARVPGFGGIEYVDPRNPDNTIVSTTPLLFDENGDTTWAVDKGLDLDHFRPGVPVAAWFWEEE